MKKQKENKKKSNLIVFYTGIFLFPLIVLFKVPLEMHVELNYLAIARFLAFFYFFFALFTSVYSKLTRLLLFVLFFIYLLLVIPVNEEIFLGEVIADSRVCEAPSGCIVLNIYEKKHFVLKYEGIFGVSDVFYGDFFVEEDTLIVNTKGSLLDLKNTRIDYRGKKYVLKELTTKTNDQKRTQKKI